MVNQMKKTSVECIAMYFTIEMLHILEKLKNSNIIHCDIKPDNFLIQRKPELSESTGSAEEMFKLVKPTLQMIDFGVSIDMSLFHEGQNFKYKYDKMDNRCPEMLEDKQWSYQVSC
jgi:checkpoint serine/threonine-protein kinase